MYDTGIADRLRAEGLRVIECDGWHTRGSGELYPGGFVFHHTAGGPNGSAPSLNGVIYGFANSAPGPLANVLQSREPDGDDIFYVVAAGRANHAGTGGWNGLEGNSSVHGLEIEHTGVEHFPEHRALLAARCAAALGRGIYTEASCAQHYEWSNWGDGSKIDVAQDVDANYWRELVRDALAGNAGGFTVGQMDDIAAWEWDTRKIVNDFTEDTHQTLKGEINLGFEQVIAKLDEILRVLQADR